MTRDEETKLNRTLDECFEHHVPMTRNDRRRLRNIVLDAIEQAGFDIVGKDKPEPRKHPTDYLKSRSDGNDHPNGGRFEGQDER